MRLRLACAVSLIAIGGRIDNVFSSAGMYQWGTNLLVAARSRSLRSCQGPRASVGAS